MTDLTARFIITFLTACVVSAGITWLVRKIALRFEVLDIPNKPRKIHQQPIPLMGGLGMYLTLVLVMLGAWTLGWLNDTRVSGTVLVALAVSGALLMIGGVLDDKFNLPWNKQFIFPVLAALLVIVSGVSINYVTHPLGSGLIHLDTWRVPISFGGMTLGTFMPIADVFLFLWLMGMMFTTKLLDGLDGLTSSVSMVASLVIFVVSLSWDRSGSTTSYLALTLGGAALGFLVWNWHPAKIFLGEGGSVLFGFVLGVLAVISGGKIATALLVMGVPILDVAWIILRRLRATGKFYQGDAQHLHFRLLYIGLTQPQVVLFLSLVALAFGSISFFTTTRGKLMALAGVLVFMFVLASILVTKYENKTTDTSSHHS